MIPILYKIINKKKTVDQVVSEMEEEKKQSDHEALYDEQFDEGGDK